MPINKVETLTGLGLSFLQAKVYLALAELGEGNARTISSASKVARQDTYRVIESLLELGLVEKIVALPNKYKCMPIARALSSLLEVRIKQTSKLQEKTLQLVKTFHVDNEKEKPDGKESQFIIFHEKGAGHLRIPEAILHAKSRVLAISTSEIVGNRTFRYAQYLQKAMKNGVKIRTVIDRKKNGKPLSMIQTLVLKGSFEIRYLPAAPPAAIVLIDDQEVFFRSKKEVGTAILWSNNTSLVAAFHDYFEKMWNSLENEQQLNV